MHDELLKSLVFHCNLQENHERSRGAEKTTLFEQGQTAIPAAIREKFGMKPGQQIEWIEDGALRMRVRCLFFR